jgi:2-polyprenyl-6-methoxyphenol hydroxylase-like FAD-dependent oxidoreductase
LKKRNPSLDVQIYERHPEYQRDHMMSIRRTSMQRYSKRTGDALEAELYSRIALSNNTAAALDTRAELRPVTHIRTKDFEDILKDHCAKLGIGVTYEKIEMPQDIMRRHPECNIFIAADGARSPMRTALLGADSVVKRDLLHSVDVKYDVKGQAEYLKEPTYDKIDMVVVETIGREENGTSSVALRFLVNEEIYNEIPDATFKKPLSVRETSPGFVPRLWEFQNLRKQFTNEERVQDSERITKIKLSQYASKKFAVTVDDDTRKAGWFFVGDAAMGLPFYRSINSGLLLGSQLGAIIAGNDFSPALKTQAYNALRPFKLAREFGTVAAKLSGLNAYRNFVRPVLRGAAFVGVVGIVLPIAAVVLAINPRARMM